MVAASTGEAAMVINRFHQSPRHRGRMAADRGENRTDNPYDPHQMPFCWRQWDRGFADRRKERSPPRPKWDDMG
jgi:hypothetical protein